jgi:putative spermidine/putrescine transport system substrate-binding protein
MALLADGIAPADVYKVLATKQGVDRAFKSLDRIKRDVVWWQAAADPALYLTDGFFVMSSAYTLWIDREQQRKKNFKIAWDGSLYDVDSWAIPKNTPKASDAYQFIAFASKPENQKALSEQLAYGPTNTKALPLLDAELAGTLPSTEANLKGALKVDTAFWIRNGEALEKRFDAWAPPPCLQPTDEDEDDIDYKGHAVCQDKHGNLHSVQSNPHADQGTPHHHGNPQAH